MKILEINKFFYRRGGADHHFLDLRKILKENGDSVIDFSMQDPKNENSNYKKYFVSNVDFSYFNLKLLLNPLRSIFSFEAKKKINKLILNEKPDIAHIHLIYHHISPSILVALKKNKIPVVMTVHDYKLICPNYTLFVNGATCELCCGGHFSQCAKNNCIRGSKIPSVVATVEAYFHDSKRYYEDLIDILIVPSDFVKEKLMFFGWSEKKILVLPHFLSPSISRIKKALPVPNVPRFAYIGRLSKEKGIKELVKWWLDTKIDYKLDVYGEGPLHKILSDMIKEAGIENIILHGQKTRKEIYENLTTTTAVIAPSLVYETFGLTIIEAFAKGIPVIAHHPGAFQELIEKSGAGILFDWKSNNLLGALKKIQKQIFRDNAILYMRDSHIVDRYYLKLKDIFKKIKQDD